MTTHSEGEPPSCHWIGDNDQGQHAESVDSEEKPLLDAAGKQKPMQAARREGWYDQIDELEKWSYDSI